MHGEKKQSAGVAGGGHLECVGRMNRAAGVSADFGIMIIIEQLMLIEQHLKVDRQSSNKALRRSEMSIWT